MSKKLNTSVTKAHVLSWAFLFVLSPVMNCHSQNSMDHGIVDLGYKMVYMGNKNPLTTTVDSSTLAKYELIKKRSDWTKEQKPLLDSNEQETIKYQVRILFEKYQILLKKEEFETSLLESNSFLQWKDSIEKSNTVYSIKFIQALVLDSTRSASDVETEISNFDPYSKKKVSGPIQINFEQLPELGTWYYQFNDLISAPIGQTTPITQLNNEGTRSFIKVIERKRLERAGGSMELARQQFADQHWSQWTEKLFSNSSHANIVLAPSFYHYSEDGMILRNTDTIATSDTMSIQLNDIIGHQTAYERFVLNPDSAIMKRHLKEYLIVPYLVAQGVSYSKKDSIHISGELANTLEIKYRSEMLFTSLIEQFKPDSTEVLKLYHEQIERFKEYGSCSFLIAYVESPKFLEEAKKHLFKLYSSHEFDANTKDRQLGFTVKFEENYSLDQVSEKSIALRSAVVGKALDLAKKGDLMQCVVLVKKDQETMVPIERVYSQLESELTQIRTQQIEEGLKKMK